MAPKRATPTEEVSASSDEEETTSTGKEEEEDGEEESSSEDDQTQPQLTQNSKTVKKPDSAKHANSESESESGTESDSESEDVPPLNLKPLASKPLEATQTKSTKKTSKSTDVPRKSTSKRGSEVEKDGRDSKRPKTKDSESARALEKTDDPKKQLFQRLWSEKDEVALLEGVIAFIEKKGTDPSKDMNVFYNFIKKSLHFHVALGQLKEKVSRLKRKFENHVRKGKKGEDKTFSRAHDQELFDLSKKIWGSAGLCGKSKSLAPKKMELDVGVKETDKVKKNGIGSSEMRNFDKGVSMATMEDYVIKRGLDMVDGSKKSEMEVKWEKQLEAELELFLKRMELVYEWGQLLLASYKKSGHH